MVKSGNTVSVDSDGGYFAIKGFLFQFDKTLIEIIQNPGTSVEIEQTQDVGTDQIYTQVKHKETQDYKPSKVKKAVKQLLNEYKENPQGKYSLYCYFRDRQPQSTTVSLEELNKILSTDSASFTIKVKSAFIKNFDLIFAPDFEAQFEALLKDIKDAFNLKDDDEAIIYHALLRNKVMNLSILKKRNERTIDLAALKSMVSQNEKVIFDLAYAKFMGNEEYLKFIKKEYFVFKRGVNIPSNERLFVVGADAEVTDQELIEIIQKIQNRYYAKENSPAPYIHLHDVSTQHLAIIKQQLWDKGLHFLDGTHFNGDRFRPQDITKTIHDIKGNSTKFKVLDGKNLESILKLVNFEEVYVLLNVKNSPLPDLPNITKTFYIEKTANILKVL